MNCLGLYFCAPRQIIMWGPDTGSLLVGMCVKILLVPRGLLLLLFVLMSMKFHNPHKGGGGKRALQGGAARVKSCEHYGSFCHGTLQPNEADLLTARPLPGSGDAGGAMPLY